MSRRSAPRLVAHRAQAARRSHRAPRALADPRADRTGLVAGWARSRRPGCGWPPADLLALPMLFVPDRLAASGRRSAPGQPGRAVAGPGSPAAPPPAPADLAAAHTAPPRRARAVARAIARPGRGYP